MPDPVLDLAAKEIKAVLDKHDLAAVLVLHSPTSILHMHAISPSWSCAKIDELGEFHMRALPQDFASEEHRRAMVERTLTLLFGLSSRADAVAGTMREIKAMLSAKFNIKEPGGEG